MKSSSRIFCKDEKGRTLNGLDFLKRHLPVHKLKEGLAENSYTM